MANLLDRTKQTILFPTGSTSGGTANPSTYLDMSGWEGCMFIIATCTQLDTTGSFVIRQSSDASTGGAYTYSTDLGVTFTTGLKQGIVVDVVKPLKKYLSIQPRWSTGRIYGYAIQYGGRRQASTEAQSTSFHARKTVVCTS